MKQTWDEIRDDHIVNHLGTNYASNRWQAWSLRMEHYMPSFDILHLVIMYILLTRGVVDKYADHVLPDIHLDNALEDYPDIKADAPVPLDLTSMMATKEADQVKDFRKQGGSIGVVAKILSMRTSRQLAIGLMRIPSPVEDQMMEDITSRSTAMGCFNVNTDMASGGRDKVFHAVFDMLGDDDFLNECGFLRQGDAFDPDTLQEDTLVVEALFGFAWRYVANEIKYTSFFCERPPFAFLASLKSDDHHDATMRWVRKLWQMLERFENLPATEKEVHDTLYEAMWPRNLLSREYLVGAAESDFLNFPDQAIRELQDLANCPLTSVPSELAHRALNAAQRENGNSKQGRAQRWHTELVSGIPENYDRTQPKPTVDDIATAHEVSLNSAAFDPKSNEFSLGEGRLGFMLEQKGPLESLLRFSAMKAFPGLTVFYLKKAISYFEVPVTKRLPTLEYDLVKLLVQFLLPGLKADEIEHILSMRHAKIPTKFSSILGSDDVGVLIDDVADKDDREQLKKHASEYKRQKAKSFLPDVAGCRLSLERYWDLRIRVSYPTEMAPFSTSRVYEEGDDVTFKLAVSYCLKWVWEHHMKLKNLAVGAQARAAAAAALAEAALARDAAALPAAIERAAALGVAEDSLASARAALAEDLARREMSSSRDWEKQQQMKSETKEELRSPELFRRLLEIAAEHERLQHEHGRLPEPVEAAPEPRREQRQPPAHVACGGESAQAVGAACSLPERQKADARAALADAMGTRAAAALRAAIAGAEGLVSSTRALHEFPLGLTRLGPAREPAAGLAPAEAEEAQLALSQEEARAALLSAAGRGGAAALEAAVAAAEAAALRCPELDAAVAALDALRRRAAAARLGLTESGHGRDAGRLRAALADAEAAGLEARELADARHALAVVEAQLGTALAAALEDATRSLDVEALRGAIAAAESAGLAEPGAVLRAALGAAREALELELRRALEAALEAATGAGLGANEVAGARAALAEERRREAAELGLEAAAKGRDVGAMAAALAEGEAAGVAAEVLGLVRRCLAEEERKVAARAGLAEALQGRRVGELGTALEEALAAGLGEGETLEAAAALQSELWRLRAALAGAAVAFCGPAAPDVELLAAALAAAAASGLDKSELAAAEEALRQERRKRSARAALEQALSSRGLEELRAAVAEGAASGLTAWVLDRCRVALQEEEEKAAARASLRGALAAPSVASLEAALARAACAGVEDEELEGARQALSAEREKEAAHAAARAALATAARARDVPMLEAAVAWGIAVGLEAGPLEAGTRALVGEHRARASRAALEDALSRRALAALRAAVREGDACGLEAWVLEQSRAALAEEERKAAARLGLQEAAAARAVGPLRAALAEGEAAGLEADEAAEARLVLADELRKEAARAELANASGALEEEGGRAELEDAAHAAALEALAAALREGEAAELPEAELEAARGAVAAEALRRSERARWRALLAPGAPPVAAAELLEGAAGLLRLALPLGYLQEHFLRRVARGDELPPTAYARALRALREELGFGAGPLPAATVAAVEDAYLAAIEEAHAREAPPLKAAWERTLIWLDLAPPSDAEAEDDGAAAAATAPPAPPEGLLAGDDEAEARSKSPSSGRIGDALATVSFTPQGQPAAPPPEPLMRELFCSGALFSEPCTLPAGALEEALRRPLLPPGSDRSRRTLWLPGLGGCCIPELEAGLRRLEEAGAAATAEALCERKRAAPAGEPPRAKLARAGR
ncbi:unnamed protein product [Prorocentrum cordatum]|uniref:Uncharacterized protein n=1 Tax=Prorocentrum cordatum TaxID=2364126 RepID=A0ABN9YGY5_9DINO|nr:unnamed protein product [Polarella glacialis]